jgi:hypothetical protein
MGSGTIWREPRGLEGKNLIRSELLLIESSLLALERFDLVLNGDLSHMARQSEQFSSCLLNVPVPP